MLAWEGSLTPASRNATFKKSREEFQESHRHLSRSCQCLLRGAHLAAPSAKIPWRELEDVDRLTGRLQELSQELLATATVTGPRSLGSHPDAAGPRHDVDVSMPIALAAAGRAITPRAPCPPDTVLHMASSSCHRSVASCVSPGNGVSRSAGYGLAKRSCQVTSQGRHYTRST